MIKTTKKHYEIFKQECRKWIDKLKLDNWEVHYRWQKEENSKASCLANLSGYIATLILSTEWDDDRQEPINEEEVESCSKHEVIHLLLARLSGNARARYASRDDLDESEEELVRKLEKILK